MTYKLIFDIFKAIDELSSIHGGAAPVTEIFKRFPEQGHVVIRNILHWSEHTKDGNEVGRLPGVLQYLPAKEAYGLWQRSAAYFPALPEKATDEDRQMHHEILTWLISRQPS